MYQVGTMSGAKSTPAFIRRKYQMFGISVANHFGNVSKMMRWRKEFPGYAFRGLSGLSGGVRPRVNKAGPPVATGLTLPAAFVSRTPAANCVSALAGVAYKTSAPSNKYRRFVTARYQPSAQPDALHRQFGCAGGAMPSP